MNNDKENKPKKKQTSFFCCSSAGTKRKKEKEKQDMNNKIKRDDIVKVPTKEEINSSSNNIDKNSQFSKVSSSDIPLSYKPKIKEETKINMNTNSTNINNNINPANNSNNPLNQSKSISKIQKEGSFISNTPKVDKNTLPNTELNNNKSPDLAEISKHTLQASYITANVKQNLVNKFDEAAHEIGGGGMSYNNPIIATEEEGRLKSEELKIPVEEKPEPIRESIEMAGYQSRNNSIVNSKISFKEGIDFTFKKSIAIDNRSEAFNEKRPNLSNFNSNAGPNDEIINYLNAREHYKQSFATVNHTSSNKGLNELDKEILHNNKKNTAESGNVGPNHIIIETKTEKENMNPTTEENMDVVDDEFKESERDNRSSDNHSVISSYVLSTPKMITGIRTTTEQSYVVSNCTHSDVSRLDTQNNILITEHNLSPFVPRMDETEYDITNENSDGFHKFIDTPKSSQFFFPNRSNQNLQFNLSNTNSNPQLREVYDKLNRKEKDIKKLNEKITKIMSEVHKSEEENKRYERRIEKEEAEGEMLRHMLNFLIAKSS
jgi:hypothetical protein